MCAILIRRCSHDKVWEFWHGQYPIFARPKRMSCVLTKFARTPTLANPFHRTPNKEISVVVFYFQLCLVRGCDIVFAPAAKGLARSTD